VIEDYGTSNLTTNYSYDLLGDLTTVMKCSAGRSGPNCPSGQLRSFTYDGLGRMTQATNPESNTFTYSYSSQGGNYLSLQSRTDPRGITTTHSYDSAGRTSRLDYSDGTYAAFSYDASGNLTQSANANVTNNYTSYDGNNRVTGSNVQVAGQTYGFSYTYDLAGDLTSEMYPSGRVLNTTFDVGTRPATVTSQGASTAYVQRRDTGRAGPAITGSMATRCGRWKGTRRN
jgi:YD repeat-containing protein